MSEESVDKSEIQKVEKVSTKSSKQSVFTPEYVGELREENKSLREKIAEAERLKQEAIDKKMQELDEIIGSKIQEVSSSYKKEIMYSKLENEAIRAGIVDVDAIRLADLEDVIIDDNNKVIGADAAIAKLKESKPYLFGKKGEFSTTSSKPTPKPTSKMPEINAANLSREDYNKLLRERGINPMHVTG